MDERFDQLANGLAKMGRATSGEGQTSLLGELEDAAGNAITEDTVTYAKMVCLDQKKRGASLQDALAFVDMWHERFGRSNFYGASLGEMKSLVEQYWDSVTCPDSEIESKYYAMVSRLYF